MEERSLASHPHGSRLDTAERGAILQFMADLANSSTETRPALSLEHAERQFEALLEVSELITQQRDLKALFRQLRERLHRVIQFDFLALILHNPATNCMRLHILETHEPMEPEKSEESPVESTPSGWVWLNQQSFVSQDTATDTRYPEFMRHLQEKGVHSIAILPLTTAQRRLGALAFGRYASQGLLETEIDFMRRVAAQVAVGKHRGPPPRRLRTTPRK